MYIDMKQRKERPRDSHCARTFSQVVGRHDCEAEPVRSMHVSQCVGVQTATAVWVIKRLDACVQSQASCAALIQSARGELHT